MSYLRKAIQHLGESVEELILLGIIILNVFDFIEIISPDWDYVKKILSLTAVCYLIYRASLTKLFFGTQHKKFDLLLLISYLALSFKNMIGYSLGAMSELKEKGAEYWASLTPIKGDSLGDLNVIEVVSPLQNLDLTILKDLPLYNALNNLTRSFTINPEFPPSVNNIYLRVSNDISSIVFFVEPKYIMHRWHNFILDNLVVFQKYALIFGMVLLVLITIYYTLKMKISAPSLLHVINEEGDPPRTIGGTLTRFCIIFAVINFFYIGFFNLVLEWLALAVDAPLIIIGVLFYFLVWLKHHNRFASESLIYKVGNVGENFIENFIQLFYTKRGLLLGLSGMLVLHMLTEIGNFLIPYVTGIKDQLYFSKLGAGHVSLFSFHDIFSPDKTSLFFLDVGKALGFIEILQISYVYLMNIISVLMIFIGPAFIWYVLFRNEPIEVSNTLTAVFFSSLLVFIITPVMSIGRITSSQMVGVDITTQSLLDTASVSLMLIIILSIIVGIASFLISQTRHKSKLITACVSMIFLFFGLYVYFFFIDTGSYYVSIIAESLRSSEYLLGIYFLIFLTMTILFYIGGFFSFIYESLS